ncbi:MAG: phosphate acyltransferase PlsX [Dehalococcoidales bacterium]|nr:phosphate acyltransferase PlsX [Dehalococcoidales bacterium]
MIIAVDAAGGDFAPWEVVKGAIKAAQEFGVGIALVGSGEILHVLAGKYLKKLPITFVEASQVIGFNEHAIQAIQTKPDSSIVVGINLLKQGKVDAFVSAGHSGAVFAAGMFILGKIEGTPRPAIGCFINLDPSKLAFLIDAGANVECRPEHLVWFAHMGSLYLSQIYGIESPRVGLLSNGAEDTKGDKLVIETNHLLKNTKLNFIGNIEGHDIMQGTAEVIVTDGFTGNIVLKTVEGIYDNWLSSMKEANQRVAKAYRQSVKTLNRDTDIGSWTKKLDFREYGGACLLGINGNVIISHGRSQATAIKNAIGLAIRTAERSVPQKIKEENND